MENTELAALIEQEIASSIGYYTGDLADSRALALQYYNGELFGNEREGESQVVSTDVFDTVEGLLPALLRIFTGSDEVVRFDPQGPEDEEAARQRTDVVNYVFYRQNNGFLVLYEWIKDALISKNGIVKYWWDDKKTYSREEYKGLSEGQLRKLLMGDGYDPDSIELISHESYEDEVAKEQKQAALQSALQQIEAQPLPEEAKAQLREKVAANFESIAVPMLHDVVIRVRKDRSKVCVQTIPPEEFRISNKQHCISIQDTLFCSHDTKKTKSELREMGCPDEILDNAGPTENVEDTSMEALARDRFLDELPSRVPPIDPSLIEVDVSDCFFRVDWDGDGIAELRHIIKVGREIWINDECDHINFSAITPIIMPHRWIGMSAADLAMADQFEKSVIKRQMLNNLYLTNNPRKAVLANQSGTAMANLDDLMNSRPGGIMREYAPNAIRNEETPFVAGASFPMLEYIDAQRETRTGVTRYSQGTDADTLNKTARGIQLIQQAGSQRLDLIARIIAETGLKDLMRGIAYMLSRYSTKAMTVRLRNKWVEVDPREWKTEFDMTVNVGLGTGSQEQRVAQLHAVGQKQMELMQSGRGYMVTDDNVYRLYTQMAEAMGFKHPEIFVSDPKSVQKPPPAPNPDLLKIESDAKTDAAKIQSTERLRVLDAQTQQGLESLKSRTQVAIAEIDAQTKKEIESMRQSHEARIAVFESNQPRDNAKAQADLRIAEMEAENERQIEAFRLAAAERIAAWDRQMKKYEADLEAQTKIEIAQIGAKATKAAAKAKPQPQPN